MKKYRFYVKNISFMTIPDLVFTTITVVLMLYVFGTVLTEQGFTEMQWAPYYGAYAITYIIRQIVGFKKFNDDDEDDIE